MKDSEDREPFDEACDDDSDPNDEDEDIDNVEADKVLSCCSRLHRWGTEDAFGRV